MNQGQSLFSTGSQDARADDATIRRAVTQMSAGPDGSQGEGGKKGFLEG